MKNKRMVNETIFEKHYDGQLVGVPVKDLPDGLQSTDLINVVFHEGYYSDNNSWDPYTVVYVLRPREETPEEIESYKRHLALLNAKSLRLRWETLQKLKAEFADITEPPPDVDAELKIEEELLRKRGLDY